MDHWEFKEAVHNYRQKSGHAINYYDGGYSVPGAPYKGKKEVQKGSLAKDKMRDLLGKSDSRKSKGSKQRNVTTLINDIR